MKVWDARNRTETLALEPHANIVFTVAFSPDGQKLVTGSAGAKFSAVVWDAATAENS